MMWFLSGIGNVPTLNVCSDTWERVESYAIRMLLACRLKIIPTSNLKLMISFLVLLILVLSFIKLLSIVASTQHTHLTLRTVLRLANRPCAFTFGMQGSHTPLPILLKLGTLPYSLPNMLRCPDPEGFDSSIAGGYSPCS
jgi:hypothetical protein